MASRTDINAPGTPARSPVASDESLCIGAPVFQQPDALEAIARDGPLAAWKRVYAQHGVQAPLSVSGDFAVALRLPGGSVFLAVDRFAVRSLCYRRVGDTLRFSDRADALADPSHELDPQAIFDYLFFHVIPSPRTIYKGVYRLPPAHYALFENGVVKVAPYWTPVFKQAAGQSLESQCEEFRQLVKNAVRTQAESVDAGRLGCFLSGGTDSSTIAGMLGQVAAEPAATYSIGFDASGYDEMEFARIASRHFKTRHHEYYVTPEDLVRSIPQVASHYDQPFGNSSALPAYYCARMAKADGIEKMLAGDGGDELFGGNSRYAMQRVFDWYDAVPAALRTGLLEPLLERQAVRKVPLLRKAPGYIGQAKVPMPDRLQQHNLLLRLGIDTVLTSDFLAAVDGQEPLRQQRQVWRSATADSAIDRMLALDWRYTLAENDLPKVCGTTQLAGVQVGFPFLDQRLLDLSLKLPPSYKLKGLKLRWFFKEALRGFLPDQIIAKKKHGFGLPFGAWATRNDALKKLAVDSLRSLAGRGVVRADFIETLIADRLPQHPGYYGEMVWILMMFEQWLRGHAPDFRHLR